MRPMSSKDDLPSRITELEMQLAHLQRLYDQLNEVVIQQAMAADRMVRTMAELENQIKQLKEKPTPAPDPRDEKPPHY